MLYVTGTLRCQLFTSRAPFASWTTTYLSTAGLIAWRLLFNVLAMVAEFE
jgi:hypothetical protein